MNVTLIILKYNTNKLIINNIYYILKIQFVIFYKTVNYDIISYEKDTFILILIYELIIYLIKIR